MSWRLVYGRASNGPDCCSACSGTAMDLGLDYFGPDCCSARSGTAMDLGLDYCRVLLALGLFQVGIAPKIDMAGRDH